MMSSQSLVEHLSSRLDPPLTNQLYLELTKARVDETVAELLDELKQKSSKVAGEAIDALPDLHRRCGTVTVVPWLDLGIALTTASGAMALKYIRESPLILGVVESAALRQQVLALSLELADGYSDCAPNCAFEFFRKAPELLLNVPMSELSRWGEIGMELADWDFVLGIEFLKESPAIARVLPHNQVRAWVKFGMKLIAQNSLGKTDYVGTLEFFRSSPAILGDVPEPELRTRIIDVGSVLADHSPQGAIEFLAESPQLLQKLPSMEWQLRVLRYGGLLADRDAEAALAFVRRCPDLLSLAGVAEDTSAVFEKWFAAGMEILAYSPEGARAYFSLETRRALASLEQAMSGVSLQQVVRSLTLFAQMICGEPIHIQANPAPPSSTETALPHLGVAGKETQERFGGEQSRSRNTVFLPDVVTKYPTREANLRLYTVMTAHELGHLEFGTYRVNFSKLQNLLNEVRVRYGIADATQTAPSTLAAFFECYPQKGVIWDLWMVLEDARIENRLQNEYPGLKDDLAELAQEAVHTRSFLHGMTAREMVLDSLLLVLSTNAPESIVIREDLKPIVERTWQEAKTVWQTDCTAEGVIVVADRIYQILDDMIGSLHPEGQPSSDQPQEEQHPDLGPGPRAAEETSGEYRPITNWSYRGAMNPEWVEGEKDAEETQGHDENGLSAHTEHLRSLDISPLAPSLKDQEKTVPVASVGGEQAVFPLNEEPDSKASQKSLHESDSRKDQGVFYDEWDGVIQDYRTKWCRIVERLGPEGSGDFVQATLAARGPAVRLLRRYFESIRPTGLRRVYGQEDGDEVDWDSLIQRVVDRRVGAEASDRVYLRRDKRERQVAVAFLIDMSGSTGRRLGSGEQRVIDVGKESLLVMSEALEAIGDTYALYGFSGQGREQVDFIVLKDFDEAQSFRAGQRIEEVTPLQQNRDGAAIRHTVRKLLGCPARHRLFILISDGKPLDDGYADEYALEDTKMALREARLSGIVPFCLTVDRDASDYLKRMYGDVGFFIIDDVMALPDRLPKVYQRLTIS